MDEEKFHIGVLLMSLSIFFHVLFFFLVVKVAEKTACFLSHLVFSCILNGYFSI